MFKIIILIIGVFSLTLQANGIKIASVAGYKKPMMQIVKNYNKRGENVYLMFGNMKKTLSHAKSLDVCMVIGDKEYLNTKSSLDIKKYQKLGEGKLVLAYAKGVKIKNIDELKSDDIKRIAMPHSKKAIYGKAAKEFLDNFKNKEIVEKKLYEVSTVLQVATYIIAKEVDAGFINLTAALKHKDKIGGYILIDKDLYSLIEIVAATLNRENCEKISDFEVYLKSNFSKNILKNNGL